MKDHLRALLADTDALRARNIVREYLQAAVLESLQRAGALVPLAFQGGTALRFLFGIRRHSEDLDFALERPGANYDFRRLADSVAGTSPVKATRSTSAGSPTIGWCTPPSCASRGCCTSWACRASVRKRSRSSSRWTRARPRAP